jgi:methylated-DNA-[protein]-cysteine S-methyltransferase
MTMDMNNWVLRMKAGPGWFEARGNCYFVISAKFLDADPGPSSGGCELFDIVKKQVEDYFSGRSLEFALPLMTQGSQFQQKILTELEAIPPGQTVTYGELARRTDSSARAVGGACRNNPIALLIPCHRVISQKGIGGYAGHTDGPDIDMKHWLLQHEV